MDSGFSVGWGIGLLIAAIAVGYAQYLKARRPEELRGVWGRLADLTRNPARAAGLVIAYAAGSMAAAVIAQRLELGTLPRDDQVWLLLMLLTVGVLVLGAFVVLTRTPAERN